METPIYLLLFDPPSTDRTVSKLLMDYAIYTKVSILASFTYKELLALRGFTGSVVVEK